MWPTAYVDLHDRDSSWNTNSSTLEADRPLHDGPAACVIPQQYPSTDFVSMRFLSPKKKFGPRFKNVLGVKLRNFKFS
jgi:hypothetical protein